MFAFLARATLDWLSLVYGAFATFSPYRRRMRHPSRAAYERRRRRDDCGSGIGAMPELSHAEEISTHFYWRALNRSALHFQIGALFVNVRGDHGNIHARV